MNRIREILRINDEELARGLAGTPGSWHQQYAQSAWVYIGNLSHELSEGDVLCVLSQFGEIEDIHLVRDEESGKSRGFAFVRYEDARSCILAVDNFTGIELCGRSLRVDHVENYRLPKHILEREDSKEQDLSRRGLAYRDEELANSYSLARGQDLFAPNLSTAQKKTETSVVESPFDDTDERRRERREERHRRRAERRVRREEREAKRSRRENRKIEEREQKRSRRGEKDKDRWRRRDREDDNYGRRHRRKRTRESDEDSE